MKSLSIVSIFLCLLSISLLHAQDRYQHPILLSPTDGYVVNTEAGKRIQFAWSPPIPKPNAMVRYQIVVYEVLPGQYPMQAFRSNHPILEVEVEENFLIWPTDIQLPQDGQQYVWAVRALVELEDEFRSAYSEVNTFTICSNNSNGQFFGNPCGDLFPQEKEVTSTNTYYPWMEEYGRLMDLSQLSYTEQDCKDINALLNKLILQKAILDQRINVAKANILFQERVIKKAEADKKEADQIRKDCQELEDRIRKEREKLAEEIAKESGTELTDQKNADNCVDQAGGRAVVFKVGNINFGGNKGICMPESKIEDYLEAVNRRRKKFNDLAKELEKADCEAKRKKAKELEENAQKRINQAKKRIAELKQLIAEANAEILELDVAINQLLALKDLCPIIVQEIKDLTERLDEFNDAWVQSTENGPGDEGFLSDQDKAKADSLIKAARKLGASGGFDEAQDLISKADSLLATGNGKRLLEDCLKLVKRKMKELYDDITKAKSENPSYSYEETVDAFNELENKVREAEKAMMRGDYGPVSTLCTDFNFDGNGTPQRPSDYVFIYDLLQGVNCPEGDLVKTARKLISEKELGTLTVVSNYDPPLAYFGYENLTEMMNDYLIPEDVPDAINTPVASNQKNYYDLYWVREKEYCVEVLECKNGSWERIGLEECEYRYELIRPALRKGIPIRGGENVRNKAANSLKRLIRDKSVGD
ncbi:MAG: hypothetical protein AAFY71_10045 [Bacteroidota bacterium]